MLAVGDVERGQTASLKLARWSHEDGAVHREVVCWQLLLGPAQLKGILL